MPRFIASLAAALLAFGAASSSSAQTAAPKAAPGNSADPPAIASIRPPAATLGATTEWIVSGVNLAPATEWLVSGHGVSVVEAKPTESGATLKVRVAADAAPGYREVRAIGPAGISNLALVRIDRLGLQPEVEPNDDPEHATPMTPGTAAWGVLKPQDLDHFRIQGKAGARVTIDLEAQRIGSPINTVLTVLSARGAPVAQARESRGIGHDARLAFTFPADGEYFVQVRDNVYAGGDSAVYRLSVEDAPFALGMYPLGGPRGKEIEVEVSGGTLDAPRTKRITLPDSPGALVDPGAFDGPGAPVLAPMKLLAGDGPEVSEAPAGSSGSSNTPITLGTTANGRIAAANEVDRYTLAAKKGEAIAVRVRASDLGSDLDSVVTLRDAKGDVLAENDDGGTDGVQRNAFALNQTAAEPDSRLVFEPKADGPITIEVADRYGEGGPGHAYRLEVGPSRPDFSLSLIFPNPGANQQNFGQRPRRVTAPGSNGALNLKPFQTVPLNILVTAEGNTGPIVVRVEGLPKGITAEPKTIRLGPQTKRGRVSADAIFLKVGPEAAGLSGEVRLVATAKPEGLPEIVRHASATIAIDTPLSGNATRPVMRTIRSLPLKVVDTSAVVVGGPQPLAFHALIVPGLLLQGGSIDIDAGISGDAASVALFQISGTLDGEGVSARVMAGPEGGGRFLRIEAKPDTPPGVRTLTVNCATPAASTSRTASVIVRPPMTLRARDEPLTLADGKPAMLWVGVEREPGFSGPVDLELVLPKGVRVDCSTTIPADKAGLEIRIEGKMLDDEPVLIRVVGVARMPRGAVRVDSPIRPSIAGPKTD